MDSIVGFCYARLPVDHAPHHRVRVLIESDIGPFRDGRPSTVDSGLQVLVRDNNVDQALKALKKKMQREGIFREMRLRDHYEKPSEKRAREKSEAVRRARKLARKALQREGLLPVKPRPVPGLR
jgi:small subunit ribosomal protein S21